MASDKLTVRTLPQNPKKTWFGVYAVFRYALLPLFVILLLLDLIGWSIARYVFDTCYGVLCLL